MEEQTNTVTQQKHTQELQNLHSSSLLPKQYSQINIYMSTSSTLGLMSIDVTAIKVYYTLVRTKEVKDAEITFNC